MKDSEIYLRAAESADKQEYCFSCNEVYFAAVDAGLSTTWSDVLTDRYAELFSMVAGSPLHVDDVDALNSIAKQKAWRVLALCFMAAIAKSEGL